MPAATPVTIPEALTVAMDVLAEIHGLTAAGDGEPVNVVVDPAQTASVPVIVGRGLTTIFISSVDAAQGAFDIVHLKM